MSVDKAVKIIIKGLERGKPIIAFPWQMHFVVWLLMVLPTSLVQRLTKRF